MGARHPLTPWLDERAARRNGHLRIAGIDEAGRGPLAGPVVAACVVLPFEADFALVADSKALSDQARRSALDELRSKGSAVGIGEASPVEIDARNILRATHLAMRRAVQNCPVRPSFALVDGLPVPDLPVSHRAIIRGDATCLSIAAASIVAKVTRDTIMTDLDTTYPGYGFARHKGYATPAHLEALSRLGPCPVHRRSFTPVRELRSASSQCLFPTPEDRSATADGVGREGERLARLYLERIGHRILATRFRSGNTDIDIVSADGNDVVFTEVKSSRHGAGESPSAGLSAAQQARIARAASRYLMQHSQGDVSCRFDVVEVVTARRAPEVRHFRAAFDAPVEPPRP
jgi:ribonuclease HII